MTASEEELSAQAEKLYATALELYEQEKFTEAFSMARRAVANIEKVFGPDHPSTTNAVDHLANLYFTQGNYAAAEPLFQQSLKLKEKAFGVEHTAVANSLRNLAASSINAEILSESRKIPLRLALNDWTKQTICAVDKSTFR